jgi:hypothetical protein
MRTHTHEISRALAAAALIALLAGPSTAATTAAKPVTAKPAGAGKASAQPAMVMPWIEDDYGKAIAEAKARKVPIFVESWAPW